LLDKAIQIVILEVITWIDEKEGKEDKPSGDTDRCRACAPKPRVPEMIPADPRR